jgi:hypothetical protein
LRRTALAIVGRSHVSFLVMAQWISTLRRVHWPGPHFLIPEIYAAGHWTGVTPLRNIATYHMFQRQDEYDSVLWIDADHMVSTGLIERIEEICHLPIVVGPYFGREYPHEIQAFHLFPEGGGGPNGVRPVDPALIVGPLSRGESRLMEVDAGGTGCMLIRKDVLLRMAELRGPIGVWRVDQIPPERQLELLLRGQSISGVVTEDMLFCLDVKRELGEQTWLDLDPRMETGHIGEQARDRRDYIEAHTVMPGQAPPDPEELRRRGLEVRTLNRAQRRQIAGKGKR